MKGNLISVGFARIAVSLLMTQARVLTKTKKVMIFFGGRFRVTATEPNNYHLTILSKTDRHAKCSSRHSHPATFASSLPTVLEIFFLRFSSHALFLFYLKVKVTGRGSKVVERGIKRDETEETRGSVGIMYK